MINIIDKRTPFPALKGVSYSNTNALTVTAAIYHSYGPKELYQIELFDDCFHFYFREYPTVTIGDYYNPPRISKEIWDMQEGTLKCRKTIYGTYHPAQSEYYTFDEE